MTKLFKPVPDELRRSIRIVIRATEAEAAQIRHAADIRNLTVSDFIRRAALGRRADVRFETKIVLALHQVVQEIRTMHKTYIELELQPPGGTVASTHSGGRGRNASNIKMTPFTPTTTRN